MAGLFSVPAAGLAIIGVALAAGRRLGPVWGLLGFGFFLGLVAATNGIFGPIEPALCLVAALAGGVAATLPGWGGLAMPLSVAAGAAAGFLTLTEDGQFHAVTFVTVLGSAVATMGAYGVAAGAAEELRTRGRVASLAVRIVAAWITAIALLLLALTLRPAVQPTPVASPSGMTVGR